MPVKSPYSCMLEFLDNYQISLYLHIGIFGQLSNFFIPACWNFWTTVKSPYTCMLDFLDNFILFYFIYIYIYIYACVLFREGVGIYSLPLLITLSAFCFGDHYNTHELKVQL